MTDLLNPDDALQQLLAHIPGPTPEQVPPEQATERTLAVDVTAPIDLPPFANSSVDGYAVRSADTSTAGTTLEVVMDIPAGTPPDRTIEAGQAARIMTGAPVPDGADAIIPVEKTNGKWNHDADTALEPQVTLNDAVSAGANIRPVGENIRKGQQVLSAATMLRPQDIGMLVSLGVAEVKVYRQPTVAIISTGDELVPVGEPLSPGKIHDSNSYTIAALVEANGGVAIRMPAAKDTLEDVRDLFHEALAQQPDMLVSTAGVSVGQYDVVRTVLDELGEIGFWRVNVRPGKPLAFGNIQGKPFFGLPGNPVSAMVTFDIFVRPALRKLGGMPDDTQTHTAITGEDMRSDGRRTYVRVRLEEKDGTIVATTTGTQSSGALMSMVLADGLLIIPEGQTHVPAGTALPVRLLR